MVGSGAKNREAGRRPPFRFGPSWNPEGLSSGVESAPGGDPTRRDHHPRRPLVTVRWLPAATGGLGGLCCRPNTRDDQVVAFSAAALACSALEQACGFAMLARLRDSFVHRNSFGGCPISPSRRRHAARRQDRVILRNGWLGGCGHAVASKLVLIMECCSTCGCGSCGCSCSNARRNRVPTVPRVEGQQRRQRAHVIISLWRVCWR